MVCLAIECEPLEVRMPIDHSLIDSWGAEVSTDLYIIHQLDPTTVSYSAISSDIQYPPPPVNKLCPIPSYNEGLGDRFQE